MKTFKKNYNRLNKEQKRAVDKIDGPLMVVAGPGSGKTELLSVRAANILKKKDVPASSLLCLTFTDSAALNMKERLVEMIGEEGYKIPTLTFHSFCKEIIDNNPEYFYQGAYFDLADEITKTEILEDILENMDYDNPLNSRHPQRGYVYL
ncbi:MAG: UvrD-helicase domain-containing protein, partial [Patescibacteria group bacterium]